MADAVKSKKSEKARLWEEAKLKEEEEARKKLLSLRFGLYDNFHLS